MINLHIPVHVFDEVKPPSSLKSIHLITKIFFIYSVYIPLRPLTRIDVQCIFSVYPSFSISKLNNNNFFPLKHFIHVICTVDLLYILHCQLI